MRVKRAMVIGVVAAVAASFGVAFAAPLGVTTSMVGAGDAAVLACDGSFTHSYTTSRGNVTAVTIGGIADPACEGGSVSATVKDGAGASIASAGPQSVPTDGDTLDNSATLSTSPQPVASQVAGIDIVVEGP